MSRRPRRFNRAAVGFVVKFVLSASQSDRGQALQQGQAALFRVLGVDRLSAPRPEFLLAGHRQFLERRHTRRTAAHGPFGLRRNKGFGQGGLSCGRRLVTGRLGEQAGLRRHRPDRTLLAMRCQSRRNGGGCGLIDRRPQRRGRDRRGRLDRRRGNRLRDDGAGAVLLGALYAVRDPRIVGLETLGEFGNSRFVMLGRRDLT